MKLFEFSYPFVHHSSSVYTKKHPGLECAANIVRDVRDVGAAFILTSHMNELNGALVWSGWAGTSDYSMGMEEYIG